MRFRISLKLLVDVSGDILPISYQYQLSCVVKSLLQEDQSMYSAWLADNNLNMSQVETVPFYSLSNLYIPKILVNQDRLQICVPRIQFWISFYPENGTADFVRKALLGRTFAIGDEVSSVTFEVSDIDDISPVIYKSTMDYQSLSPIVIKAFRANHSLEYLTPMNPVFGEFLVDGLIERWEHIHACRYMGSRDFHFEILSQPRRKSVAMQFDSYNNVKEVGFMLKFRLSMAPELQELLYVTGAGDDVKYGFGYIELIRKYK